jgi:hypothetical protein
VHGRNQFVDVFPHVGSNAIVVARFSTVVVFCVIVVTAAVPIGIIAKSVSPSESLLSLGSTSEICVVSVAGLSDRFSLSLLVPLVALVSDWEGEIS